MLLRSATARRPWRSGKWTDECVKALAGRDIIILEDKKNGRKRALASAHALHGAAKTIRIVLLPDIPDGKDDVSDWLDADPHRAEKFVDVCFAIPEWTYTYIITSTAPPATLHASPSTPPLPFINIAAWQDQPVPQRQVDGEGPYTGQERDIAFR